MAIYASDPTSTARVAKPHSNLFVNPGTNLFTRADASSAANRESIAAAILVKPDSQ